MVSLARFRPDEKFLGWAPCVQPGYPDCSMCEVQKCFKTVQSFVYSCENILKTKGNIAKAC